MKKKPKSKKIIIIKVILYLLLVIFLLYILYLMYLQPYTKNGTHLLTKEECDNSYDCKCTPDSETMLWCYCKYKKWFIISKGYCAKEIITK